MRRALAVLASIGLGIATIALAIPAHALAGIAIDGGSGVVSVSDTRVAITNSNTVPYASDLSFSTSDLIPTGTQTSCAAGCVITQGQTVDYDIDPSASGVLFWTNVVGGFANGAQIQEVSVTYNSGGGGDDSGSSGGAGSAPALEIQQFGLPASGNCEDGATEAMNWSGIGMDGWGISWARWMNDGAGGAVCTRTVMYDTSTAKWVVN